MPIHTPITYRTSTALNRDKAPVFVLGSVRSGTTLLYHMLLSAGEFALYRSESNAINYLEPRFGDLSRTRNKMKLMNVWLTTGMYERSGLDAEATRTRVMAECRNGGDFLQIIMGEIAKQQNVKRWAECTPEHILYLDRIKATIPNALIVHIIRDGRDVALSSAKLRYIRRMWWDHTPDVMVAGLHWEWMVRKGRADGRRFGSDYMELRFEDLILEPRVTLAKLSSFIDQELDYDRILRVAIGSVANPNTSFKDNLGVNFNPIERWKRGYTEENLAMLEALIGGTLKELGYRLACDSVLRNSTALSRMRAMYHAFFSSKLWLKAKTPLGRLLITRNLSWLSQ